MIQNKILNFTFIHNPKCAGSTIRQSLKALNGSDLDFWMFEKIQYPFGGSLTLDKAHIPLDCLALLYPRQFKFLCESFSFCFARHPITRLVSAFLEFENNYLGVSKRGVDTARAKRFKDYIKRRILASRLDRYTIHALPQLDFIYHCGSPIDLVVPLERWRPVLPEIERHSKQLAAVVGEALKENFVNMGQKEEKAKELWNSLPRPWKRLVFRYYKLDFEYLGYGFDVGAANQVLKPNNQVGVDRRL